MFAYFQFAWARSRGREARLNRSLEEGIVKLKARTHWTDRRTGCPRIAMPSPFCFSDSRAESPLLLQPAEPRPCLRAWHFSVPLACRRKRRRGFGPRLQAQSTPCLSRSLVALSKSDSAARVSAASARSLNHSCPPPLVPLLQAAGRVQSNREPRTQVRSLSISVSAYPHPPDRYTPVLGESECVFAAVVAHRRLMRNRRVRGFFCAAR